MFYHNLFPNMSSTKASEFAPGWTVTCCELGPRTEETPPGILGPMLLVPLGSPFLRGGRCACSVSVSRAAGGADGAVRAATTRCSAQCLRLCLHGSTHPLQMLTCSSLSGIWFTLCSGIWNSQYFRRMLELNTLFF